MAFVPSGLDDARKFITRVIAIPEDGDGYIGIHNTWEPKDHKGGKLPFGQGIVASDVDDFIAKLPRVARSNNRDIYVCMGTQKRHMETVNRTTGEIRYVPDKHKDNIYKLKSLYLDLDFKLYASQTAAELVFSKFLGDAGLPDPSVVVHTGGGFHVYWVFTKFLPTSEWQVLASQLVEATKQHNLKCDTAVTIDASRVLRVPGTLNYKYNPPRDVVIHTWGANDYEPDTLASVLSKYPVNLTGTVRLTADLSAFKGVKPFQSFQNVEEITELGDGCHVHTPVDLKLVHPQCGFIREALTTEGKNFDNPLWNLTTLLSVFTTQGRTAAHVMARGHADYVVEHTDKLYDRKEMEVHSRGVGWPRCATIKASGAEACKTCPHFSKGLYPFSFIQTPPSLEEPPVASEPAIQWLEKTGEDVLPPGYLRDSKGLVYRLGTNKDGENFEVYPSRSSILSDAYLSMPPATIHFKAQITPYSLPVHVAIANRYLHAASADMTNVLADAGVDIDKKAIGEFLVAWVEKLKESRKTFTEHPAFGWAEEGTNSKKVVGFSYAGKLYTPEGTFIAKELDTELTKQYRPVGSLDEWKRATKMVTDTKRAAMDAILASAFAAPLVFFTGEQGLYFGVHSEDSGVGKTTAMRTAQSVWSDPSALQRLADTANSVQHKMGILRHLPIAWDELKGEDALKAMALLIFELTSGRSKSRLTAKIEQRETFTWHTLLVSASNNSMSDYLNQLAKNNDAGFYRLFELEVEPPTVGRLSLAEAGANRITINQNYGVAGQVYAQFLGTKHELVRKIITAQQTKLEAEFQIIQPERLWFNVAVVLLVGAQFGNALGLTEIDVDALKIRLFEEIKAMRGTVAETPLKLTDPVSISAMLVQYLRENARKIIITSDIWMGVGRPSAGAVSLIYPITTQPMDGMVGQFGQKSRTLRLATKPLYDWLFKKETSRTTFVHGLKKSFTVTHRQKQCLGTGIIGIHGAQEAVFDIDCSLADDLGTLAVDIVTNAQNVVPFSKPVI